MPEVVSISHPSFTPSTHSRNKAPTPPTSPVILQLNVANGRRIARVSLSQHPRVNPKELPRTSTCRGIRNKCEREGPLLTPSRCYCSTSPTTNYPATVLANPIGLYILIRVNRVLTRYKYTNAELLNPASGARPMAPARSSNRRAAQPPPAPQTNHDLHNDDPNINTELFVDPMLGTALAVYIEKDVEDKELISQLIIKHGGTISPGYSGVPYILVDPHKPSGQNLWRQYAGKKGKIILDARWVQECVKANQLHNFHTNWAGCKVTGTETVYQTPREPEEPPNPPPQPPPPMPQHPIHPGMPPVQGLHAYPFQVYAPPPMQPQPGPPPREMAGAQQQWQVTIAPAQAHLHAPPPGAGHPQDLNRPPPPPPSQPHQQSYRDDAWDGYNTPDEMAAQPAAYEYRYREDQNNWVPTPGPYYDPAYEQGYGQQPYMEDPEQSSGSNSVSGQLPPGPIAGPSGAADGADPAERTRGRKRTRTQPVPAAPAASLVVNRNPPARSPTPPSRVIKSTYGGNLFTADDVVYLKKYIDYCQDQCLVLSLREICERVAVKAPHHTFYSWRRYCNKHQIRLGGYAMNNDRSESPGLGDDLNLDIEGTSTRMDPSPNVSRLDINSAMAAAAAAPLRNRSPTPPRALYRSTTGKGVAFTQEDVTFLIRFMNYRKSQGTLDMVAFWKDVAAKAPHHSRASWMKFWRRHKHEMERSEADEPLPAHPDKKMRYSKDDDILLAKHFYHKPDGTSDKIFQAFARQHSHHPWKGWQEHYRIHKAKIEHLMQLIANGENLDSQDMDES
ncbi:unnamed protein product [Cyclocybe aegerita]|uniref:BRCT domain-containing protein n=1 Tax=Cyclocybe aegerita TaxID=1973307 RepID=A0A8S0XMQ1_CYCAE|nr:unnamed protein product [Cyclocybe aegerita]